MKNQSSAKRYAMYAINIDYLNESGYPEATTQLFQSQEEAAAAAAAYGAIVYEVELEPLEEPRDCQCGSGHAWSSCPEGTQYCG